MPSALSKSRDYESIAKTYSEINEIQVGMGKQLAVRAGIKSGDKVIDMGCGTGELTAFLAEKVGKNSQVVGVDPDFERIKVADEKNAQVNIVFKHGDSSSEFPHHDEEYFDLHLSNFVFQWLNSEEKKLFINTAFNCLKPAGKIAIQSHDKEPDILKEFTKKSVPYDMVNTKPTVHLLMKSATEDMLRNAGFIILSSKYLLKVCSFQNIEHFSKWVYASDYHDGNMMSVEEMKDFRDRFVNKDGGLTFRDHSVYQIIAIKPRQ